VVNSFEKAIGGKLNYEMTDARAGDIESIWADTTKATNVLGWKA